jgi:hypothetical protein
VNQATKLKAKAGRLQEEGSQLLDKASAEKGKAAELKVGEEEIKMVSECYRFGSTFPCLVSNAVVRAGKVLQGHG